MQSGNRGPHSICYLQGREYDFVSLRIPLGIGGRDGTDDDIGAVLDGEDGFEAPLTPTMKASLASLWHSAFVGRAGRLHASVDRIAAATSTTSSAVMSRWPLSDRATPSHCHAITVCNS